MTGHAFGIFCGNNINSDDLIKQITYTKSKGMSKQTVRIPRSKIRGEDQKDH